MVEYSENKDGRIFAPENNPSTPDNPIELPDGTQSLADIQMFMPVGKTSISLNELVNAPYNYGVDENGDLITATGNLTLDLRDSQDIEVNLRDKLIPCSPSDYPINYYSINLSNNEGKLTTKYGYPNTTSFNAANVIYYVIPKPIVCYIAQPNGIIGDDSFPQIDGPASQWVRHRGYLPQNIEDPATNFPTTGTHGLNFNLMLSNGVNWQNISYDKSPSSSGLDIVLNGEYSYFGGVNIFLSGPNGGTNYGHPDPINNNPPESAVPTTFTIYSDKAKTNKIYSFTISKWFISKIDNNYETYDANYCNNHYGNRYRIPIVSELTNANGDDWHGGLAGQPNNYQRRIGGGLYTEWGYIDTEFYSHVSFSWYGMGY
ncbi:hypothetical protein PT276_06700 [Orbaceae bacterium ESL0721]|nr:hypothetical protein [Orbaceae bacterium ESL0721]